MSPSRRSPRAAADPDVDPGAEPDADPESVARAICLRQLTAAPRTRAELRAVLQARRVPGDACERVLDRLSEVGLVDDRAFAVAWVSSRQLGRGLSKRALTAELHARGVPDELVAAATQGVGADDELASARALVARRLGATAGVPMAARYRRLTGMLARRGYPAGLAARVVREAITANGATLETTPGDAFDDEGSATGHS